MIFVDTSVWVAALRGDAAVGRALSAQLDLRTVALAAPVRVELLGGTRGEALPKLRRALAALPTFYPTRDTWALAERWATGAAARGHRFGVGDLLVGAVAAEHGGQVWSLDADFDRLRRLKLVRTYAPS